MPELRGGSAPIDVVAPEFTNLNAFALDVNPSMVRVIHGYRPELARTSMAEAIGMGNAPPGFCQQDLALLFPWTPADLKPDEIPDLALDVNANPLAGVVTNMPDARSSKAATAPASAPEDSAYERSQALAGQNDTCFRQERHMQLGSMWDNGALNAFPLMGAPSLVSLGRPARCYG